MQKFLVLKKRPTEALFRTLENLLFFMRTCSGKLETASIKYDAYNLTAEFAKFLRKVHKVRLS